jgi:hypothetical protein
MVSALSLVISTLICADFNRLHLPDGFLERGDKVRNVHLRNGRKLSAGVRKIKAEIAVFLHLE